MRVCAHVALAAACAFVAAAPVHALPIVGASASTIPAGTFMVDTWGSWLNFTRSWQEDSDGGAGWVGFREGTQWTSGSLVPRVYYGVTDWLTVRAALPLEDRYRQYDFDEPAMSASGLGDIVIDPKIQVYKSESGYPRVAALAGVRFPTGDTGGDGAPALSDGSTDYMLGAAVTHREGFVTGHACVVYWFNGERENGTDVADLAVALASIETAVDESWTLLWEFKGVFGETASEFSRTYVCPGIMWSGERLDVGLSALASAGGTGQVGVSTLDYDWAPFFRVYYRFF